jgi:hypothetical protein
MRIRLPRREILYRVLLWSSAVYLIAVLPCIFARAYGVNLPFIPQYIPEASISVVVSSLVLIGCSYVSFCRGKKDEESKPQD